ncbi:helix-turn-helix domain-containing protein [Micromonospora aurantiaca (nom. illeg.)]|uniref:helix-turn-helix domain-containing protein n=1 Tax=Micromonospora aurantiaca (nom. illeg.) TaxID=47850 RepID=UPI0035AF2793
MVDSDEIKNAWRDLGRTLAQLRVAAGHTQHGFAGLVQYGRSSVANTETGRQQPDRAFWVRCDMVLQTGGALVKEYDAIVALARQQRRASALRAAARSTPVRPQAEASRDDRATDRQSDEARVGLSALAPDLPELSSEPEDDAQPDEIRASSTTNNLGPVNPALAPHWMAMLRILAASHHAFGPRRIHDVARGELAIIHHHGARAEGQTLRELQRVEARWAEFASWTADNLGDGRDASYWLRRALSLSRDAGDDQMVSYVLMRQAQRAAERRDIGKALALAQASTRSLSLAARDRALCAVRQAQANALAGKSAECWAALQNAQQFVEAAEDHDDPEAIGQHCGPAYVIAHVGQCHLLLGKSDHAVAILEEVLHAWPGAYRQDEGMTRTWLATAYALLGRIDEAAEEADKVLALAAEAGSMRLTQALRRVDTELAAHQSQPFVQRFRARYALATQINGTMSA